MARIRPDLMMIDGGYEPLVAVIAQAVAASPAVVDTPSGVKPSAIEALKVAEQVAAAVAPIIAPDVSDEKLRQIAKQTTTAVVTNPAVIAAPAGQTVNTTTLQGIVEASVKMPYDSTKPATTVTMPYTGTTTPSVKNLDTTTLPTTSATTLTLEEQQAAVRKLTGGQQLTDAERSYLNLGPKGQTVTTPLTGTSSAAMNATSSTTAGKYGGFETALEQSLGRDIGSSVNYNAKIDEQVAQAQAVAAKPIMSAEQQAGGGVVKWIGGVSGKWEIVMPIGSPLVGSKAAGWEPGRNSAGVESGVSPTGVIPGAGATVNVPVATATSSTSATTTAVTTTATTTTATTSTGNTVVNVNNVTDPATLALIQSLQSQIASLTKAQTDATNNAATTAAATAAQLAADKATARKNAIDVLTERFQRYGLGSLVNKIKDLAVDGATEATITLGLQETDEYKQRFKANQERIKKGLAVLNPAEYLNVEDGYRQVLRAYGLKQFDTDDYVSQFIANDVSAAELSNRVVTAVQRVQNADPAISKQLRDFYGIGQADLVAYVLDPNQQFQKIERQVAASEIGVAAARQGLQTGVSVAEQLAAQGVTQAEAQKGYATIADILPTAEKLSDIYGKTMDTYGQGEAEQEVFNSLASAQRKRQKLTQREVAAFSGSSGTNRTSLTTSSVGQF